MTKLKTKTGAFQPITMLSGPMRGEPEWNYPLFHEVEQAWLAEHPKDNVLNPAANFHGRTDLSFETYMQKSLEQALACNFMVLLPGWENSEGSQHEVRTALVTDKIFYSAKPKGEAFGARTGWEFEWMPKWEVEAALNDEPTIISALPPSLSGINVSQVKENIGYVMNEYGTGLVRTFESGATRDTEDGKLDYEAFLSPLVLERYARYMHEHRKRSDGSLRAGDDWQKGIPVDVYMKSMWRHFIDVWHRHRVGNYPDGLKAEALCGVLFNAMGYLHELEKRSEL